MPNIFLYRGNETGDTNITLRDPTVGAGGSTVVEADWNSAGAGIASFVSATVLATVLNAIGTGAASYVSATVTASTLNAAGGGVATFTSATVKAGVLNATGTGTASWNSSAIAGVVWNAAGTGTATFAGENAATGGGINQVVFSMNGGWYQPITDGQQVRLSENAGWRFTPASGWKTMT